MWNKPLLEREVIFVKTAIQISNISALPQEIFESRLQKNAEGNGGSLLIFYIALYAYKIMYVTCQLCVYMSYLL